MSFLNNFSYWPGKASVYTGISDYEHGYREQMVNAGSQSWGNFRHFFLALETRQNNELMEAEATFRVKENRSSGSKLIVASPDHAALMFKFRSGETLSPIEEFKIRAYWNQVFINWQWEYSEFLAGRLEVDAFPLSQYRNALQNVPLAAEEWDAYKLSIPFDQKFLEFMETEVLQ